MDCITAGNVMVHLFMQTQPQYRLTNKKLQYLLCAAQMLSLSMGHPLFAAEMRNLKNDFALEPIADTFINNKDIQEGVAVDRGLTYSHGDFVLPYSRKKLYEIKETISEEEQWVLVETFIRFGGYQESSLCGALNRMAPLRRLPILTYVTLDAVSEFLELARSNPDMCPGNPIVLACQEVRESVSDAEAAADEPDEVAQPETGEDVGAIVASADEATDDAPEDTPNAVAEENADVVGPVVTVPPVCLNLLKGHTGGHLEQLVVGKRYSMYVETVPGGPEPVVTVLAVDGNAPVTGELSRVSECVYCYSFLGVASDVKITLDI